MYKIEDVKQWEMELAVIKASERKAKRKGVMLSPARHERKEWLEMVLRQQYDFAEDIEYVFDEGLGDN